MKKKRIIFLHRYDRSAASFRARCECYFQSLQHQNYEVLSQSLLGPFYWKYSKSKILKTLLVFFYYIRRLLFLFRLRRSDEIILYVELFPFLPPWVESCMHFLGIRWIYDIDDAFFHNYDQHRKFWVRKIFGKKMGTLMRLAKKVIVGNRYLAAYANRHHSSIAIIPSVVDLRNYKSSSIKKTSPLVTVGWIGTPATTPFLKLLEEPFQKLAEKYSFRVLLVGAAAQPFSQNFPPNIQIESRVWNEGREANDIAEMDIGLMPLPDNSFTRGKGGMKIMQYMAASVPAIASPIGFNNEIIQNQQNGLLVKSSNDWTHALEQCLQDADLRAKIGQAGRKTVEKSFCLDITLPSFLNLIESKAEV